MLVRDRSRSPSSDEMDDNVEGNEGGANVDVSGGQSRLSRFKRPRVATASLYRSSHITSKSKTSRKGRNFGKLMQLMGMPLDVFFEITARLEPLDILQLSRVSKHFRSIFASQSSRHIWVAARSNISGMPHCPQDLSEPQYASLMFEHHCQACGGSRAQKTDYALRVRFCGSCFKENVQKGSTLMRPYRKLPDLILTLLPRSMLKTSSVYRSGRRVYDRGTFDNCDNGRQNAYYVPELEMIVKRYQELESDSTALNRFIEQQRVIASQMMKDAINLGTWVGASKSQRAINDDKHMQNRQASIEAKLMELGWEKKYFPSRFNREWNSLVRQPRELTPRIWKLIHPRLEAMLKANKQEEVRRQYQDRCTKRRHEFLPMWMEFVNAVSDPKKRDIMPHYIDACEMPTIASMLYEDDAQIPVTQERWLAITHSVPHQVEEFQNKIKCDLLNLLEKPRQHWYLPPAKKVIQDQQAQNTSDNDDFNILEAASSLFVCDIYGCKKPVGYRVLFDHPHLNGLKWSSVIASIQHEAAIKPTVMMVLKALDLPDDTSLTAMEAMDGRLTCLCGHPDFLNPLTFTSLVRHIMDENRTYDRFKHMGRSTKHSEGVGYYNDHSLTSSESFVALISLDELATREEKCKEDSADDSSVPGDSQLHQPARYCRYCYGLTWSYCAMKSEDEAAYHMRAKHHRDMKDGDIATMGTLHQWTIDG